MKNLYKLILILFLIPLTVFATEKRGKYTKNKTIKKEFTVNKNATLDLKNKYGNVDIISNTSNSIQIEVHITVSGNNEEKVQDRLDQINVEFENSASRVSAKTIIESNSSSWNIWGKKNNVNMEINYIVKMPVSNNLNVSNDYGAINLNKLEGVANINCDYGKIDIGELTNFKNSINIDYTNKSNIEFMKNGNVNADYSTLHIEKSGNVDLNADYSHMSFGNLTTLDYNCDYGDLKIKTAEGLSGNSDYMHTSVGELSGPGKFNMDYGSLKIQNLKGNFKLLDVRSSYSPIKIGVGNDIAFNIEANLSYGSFNYTEGYTFNKQIEKSTSKYYEGYYNRPNSGNIIIIKSSYGSINFKN